MNALTELITQNLKAKELNRSDIPDLLGYGNSNKCFRQIDQALNDLIDPNQLLPKLAESLQIPAAVMHAVYAQVANELLAKDKATFKPSVYVKTQKSLSVSSARSRSLKIKQPDFTSVSDTTKAFDLAASYFKAHKQAYNDTAGYTYHHSIEHSYTFDNDGDLIYVRNNPIEYPWRHQTKYKNA